MSATAERSVSGRTIVIVSLVIAVAITLVGALFGPGLREQVRQETRPRTLREPIATGTYDGQVWEAVGRFDGTANCVELQFRGKQLGRACDRGTVTEVTTLPGASAGTDGPTIAYGVVADDRETVHFPLQGGERLAVAVQARDLGFPVGFWATELPPDAEPAEAG